ncbi:MAG: hypothetical protein OEM02_04395 [Desulfobulbaceae bacterium]|nr:hypothetical protein [Desulfobulbaceae bacterium]
MNEQSQGLRLPKLVEKDSRSPMLISALKSNSQQLWSQSKLKVPIAQLDDHLVTALKDAYIKGQIVRGLESAERTLAAEERGLRIADQKTGQARGIRVSRILLLANDGAERFYRQVETLLLRHGQRVLAIRLDINADKLGSLLFGPNKIAKSVMLEHKSAVASILLSLADQWEID